MKRRGLLDESFFVANLDDDVIYRRIVMENPPSANVLQSFVEI